MRRNTPNREQNVFAIRRIGRIYAMRDFENDSVSQGELLRKALTDHVRSARKSGEYQRAGREKHRFIAVNDIIKKYVPEGSTFDYAENVLRSAGFSFASRPTPSSPGLVGSEYEFDVNAVLGPERLDGVKCVVALRPVSPYDYGIVHRVLTTCGFILI
jgi:hypothetical protein